MPCNVKGNVGTTLEHLVLTEVVNYVCSTIPADSWLHYVDTHCMCPTNLPVGQEGIFDRLWRYGVPDSALTLSLFFEILQDSQTADPDHYPSHVVFAAKAAQLAGSKVWASMFEICPSKWPHIERFLANPETVPSQGLSLEHIRGTLGHGDFRTDALWAESREAMARAEIDPAARVVFCDPMSYILDDVVCASDQMCSADLAHLHNHFGTGLPTFFILFTNEQDRARFLGTPQNPSRASRYAEEYSTYFLAGDATPHEWCMFRANNNAVYVGCSGFEIRALARIRARVDTALTHVRDRFGLSTNIDIISGEQGR